MKYFTPELIVCGRSEDDDILDEVEALWDERGEAYSAYLATVRKDLPPGLRHIEDSYYLHDAKVRGLGQRDGAFVVMLQLDTPPQSLLTFTYELVEAPTINQEAIPEQARSKGMAVEWQYDEVEKVEGAPPTWRQSVLLSNGWEVTLHFRDIKVEEAQALLPAPRNGAVMAGVVPQSA